MPIVDDLRSLTTQHIEQAVADLEAGNGAPGFGPSRDWDLLFRGKRYSPKQVVGIAVRHATGRHAVPSEKAAAFRVPGKAGRSPTRR